MKPATYSKEEITRRGQEIYERQIREKVESQNRGRFLVIDIETGEYEIDDDDLTASLRAFRKKPEGTRYGMRIGYPTAGTIGPRFLTSR